MTRNLFIKYFVLAAVAVIALGQLSSTFAATVRPHSKITGIEIEGNQQIKTQTILDAVLSQTGDEIIPAKIELDLKAIYNLGYFKNVKNRLQPYQGGTKITFLIEENPLVSAIIFTDNTAVPTSELTKLISTKVGEVLNYQNIQTDIAAINDYYQKNGYALAKVVDVTTDPQTNAVIYKIQEGVVESIVLEGNDNTQDYVIKRELNSKPGTVFNQKTLEKDLRRVFNLGFFSEVNPDIQPGTKAGQVILMLNIKEARTNTANFGGGYGEREGWFGFVDLAVNNLMGTGQGLLARGQFGSQLSTYQFRYTNPWFLPERLGDRTSLALRRWYTVGQDVYLSSQNQISNGFSASIGKTYKDLYSINYSLSTEKVDPYQTASFESYLSEAVGVSVSYDTRDIWMNPTKGGLFTLTFKDGLKHAASGTTGFFKTGFDGNGFFPLTRDNPSPHVLALHAGLGMGFGDLPYSEQFWCGGANTVRGYGPSEYRIGNRRFLGNIEYRYTINETFQTVFFFDFGDAYNQGLIHPSNFMTGWGPGIRMNTPMGPIRLDYGVASGRTFGEGYLHFSIGQAF